MRYLSLIIILLFAACKKDKDEFASEKKSIAGKWRLRYSVGGIAGSRWSPPKDTIILLQIKVNGMLSRSVNGREQGEDRYTLRRDVQDNSLIIAYGDGTYWQHITSKNDSLFLSDHFPDGIASTYVRQ